MATIIRKIVLLFLVPTVFSSCAIHANFPFFCFKKECIVSAWTFKKEAGGKRGVKQKVSIFFAKVNAKKRKRQNQSIDVAKLKVNQQELDALLADTTKTKELVKIVFYYKGKSQIKKTESDSVYLKSSFITLSENDRIIINYYLNKYLVKNITEIYISYIVNDAEALQQNNRFAIMKTKKVVHYFIRTGVKKQRIKIKKE